MINSNRADRSSRELHIVTGATSGIGLAIAHVLATHSRRVLALGRNEDALAELRERYGDAVRAIAIDLRNDTEVERFTAQVVDDGVEVRALVHCAGVHFANSFRDSPVVQLDEMYRSNVRAQYLLTQKLLPALERARGYVICVNSSAGLAARAGAGAYSATQHAMRALAESWRLELNERGIRILNIYPGRTFTPRIAKLFAQEGRPLTPELLLQPEDIARLVLLAIELPERVELTDISLRPTWKSY
jgi:NADP-dependent 3-hydroxy acid dehydrogenase YdfG